MDNKGYLRGNYVLVASWFGASLTCFLFALTFLVYLTSAKTILPHLTTYQAYLALPASQTETTNNVTYSDGRAKSIENFFMSYNSVLASEADLFITVADKYKLDWRLLPAISMQESNGGKKVINDSFNPFGFGIYGSSVIKFNSWGEGIERVGRTLRSDYLDQGLHTPEQIMTKYTPPSLAKGGTWAIGVKTFMEELK